MSVIKFYSEPISFRFLVSTITQLMKFNSQIDWCMAVCFMARYLRFDVLSSIVCVSLLWPPQKLLYYVLVIFMFIQKQTWVFYGSCFRAAKIIILYMSSRRDERRLWCKVSFAVSKWKRYMCANKSIKVYSGTKNTLLLPFLRLSFANIRVQSAMYLHRMETIYFASHSF